jgi:FkbM family methyltransferase
MLQLGQLTLKCCRYGWMLFSGPYIGKCFELYGEYSESEVSLMRSFLKEGCTAVDVGANIGDLTVPLAGMVGDSGRVYAIESHPETFNILCANLALNGIVNTKPINAFIAASEDVDVSETPWGANAYTGLTWQPNFLALDSLKIERCDLLKIDVDGKELEVLRSGEMLVERFRPVLYFENDMQELSESLLAFTIDTLGYDLYWHAAPIFRENNFFGNPVNHWAPKNICSLMVLGLPSELKLSLDNLPRVQGKSDWWDRLLP